MVGSCAGPDRHAAFAWESHRDARGPPRRPVCGRQRICLCCAGRDLDGPRRRSGTGRIAGADGAGVTQAVCHSGNPYRAGSGAAAECLSWRSAGRYKGRDAGLSLQGRCIKGEARAGVARRCVHRAGRAGQAAASALTAGGECQQQRRGGCFFTAQQTAPLAPDPHGSPYGSGTYTGSSNPPPRRTSQQRSRSR